MLNSIARFGTVAVIALGLAGAGQAQPTTPDPALAAALAADARVNPGEAPGPENTTPAAVSAWANANIEAGDWTTPYLGPDRIMMLSKNMSVGAASGKVRGSIRTEFFQPTLVNGQVVRSVVNVTEFDCAAKTVRVAENRNYARRNMKGRAQVRQNAGVTPSNADPGVETYFNKACPPGGAQARPMMDGGRGGGFGGGGRGGGGGSRGGGGPGPVE